MGKERLKMGKTIQSSEYCTVGHPDRTCDYIASYILDRHLERDKRSRVALEVQLKDNFCTVSGEITSRANFSEKEIAAFCREALEEIGYTSEYQERFGRENVIATGDLEVVTHISTQSSDIAQGVNADGWGDQGIFFGLAVDEPHFGYLPKDFFLARKLGQEIAGKLGGLDVKTLVTLENDKAIECYVAIPLLPDADETPVRLAAERIVGRDANIVINGTGRYVKHGSIGDCGTTGRKLVVDFYGGNSKIGGGSPWGKDPTKADVALNIYARMRALEYMKKHKLDWVQCAISCCIGKQEITVSFFDEKNNLLETHKESAPASHVIESLGLRFPGYAKSCARGLFGYE